MLGRVRHDKFGRLGEQRRGTVEQPVVDVGRIAVHAGPVSASRSAVLTGSGRAAARACRQQILGLRARSGDGGHGQHRADGTLLGQSAGPVRVDLGHGVAPATARRASGSRSAPSAADRHQIQQVRQFRCGDPQRPEAVTQPSGPPPPPPGCAHRCGSKSFTGNGFGVAHHVLELKFAPVTDARRIRTTARATRRSARRRAGRGIRRTPAGGDLLPQPAHPAHSRGRPPDGSVDRGDPLWPARPDGDWAGPGPRSPGQRGRLPGHGKASRSSGSGTGHSAGIIDPTGRVVRVERCCTGWPVPCALATTSDSNRRASTCRANHPRSDRVRGGRGNRCEDGELHGGEANTGQCFSRSLGPRDLAERRGTRVGEHRPEQQQPPSGSAQPGTRQFGYSSVVPGWFLGPPVA